MDVNFSEASQSLFHVQHLGIDREPPLEMKTMFKDLLGQK